MANLPATTSQNATSVADQRFLDLISEHIHAGKTPAQIAKVLAPEDAVRRRYWRAKIFRHLATDDRLARKLAERSRVELLMGLGGMTRGLVRRGRAGRVDATKLAFEAVGFHNPRVQHEHSGEVTIKIDMPRPKFVDNQEPVTDGEVVED